MNDQISSAKMIFTDGCNVYPDYNCKGNALYLNGDDNWQGLDNGWNDVISSIDCHPYSAYGNNGYAK